MVLNDIISFYRPVISSIRYIKTLNLTSNKPFEIKGEEIQIRKTSETNLHTTMKRIMHFCDSNKMSCKNVPYSKFLHFFDSVCFAHKAIIKQLHWSV